MTKVYKASSIPCIVVNVNGHTRRVSFVAKTGGGSTFRTDDEDLQKAIERHYRFGELFKLGETIEDKKPKKSAPTSAKVDDAPTEKGDETNNDEGTEDADAEGEEEDTNEAETTDAPSDLIQVNVTDPDDAKDYLCEKFGYSRTKLRSLKAIKEAALVNGVEFVGI